MKMHRSRWLASGVLAAAGLLALAGCGSSSKTSSSATTPAPTTAQAASPTSAAATSPTSASGMDTSEYTISTAKVPGVGTVLVNGEGRTLYLLSSEKGNKVTCTNGSACAKIWPVVELPAGVSKATAGSGIQASLLGTAMDPSGMHRVTYGTYPVYLFIGDRGAGTAKGQGITSFGGTWYAIQASGQPAMGSASSPTTTPTTSSGGGAGGGY